MDASYLQKHANGYRFFRRVDLELTHLLGAFWRFPLNSSDKTIATVAARKLVSQTDDEIAEARRKLSPLTRTGAGSTTRAALKRFASVRSGSQPRLTFGTSGRAGSLQTDDPRGKLRHSQTLEQHMR